MKYIFHITDTLKARVHLGFSQTKDVTHIYFYYNTKDLRKIYRTGVDLLVGKKVSVNDKNVVIKLTAYTERFKPKAILVSISSIIGIHDIKKVIKKYNVMMYYVLCGIVNPLMADHIVEIFDTQLLCKDKMRKKVLPVCDGYIMNSASAQTIMRSKLGKIHKDKIIIVNGLSQFRYIRELDLSKLKEITYKHICAETGRIMKQPLLSLDMSKRSILFVQNFDGRLLGTNDESVVWEEYHLIVSILTKIANDLDVHLFIKIKRTYGSAFFKEFNKDISSKNITLIPYDAYAALSDFLFADIVLIETFGNSFYESLLINPITVQVDPLTKNNALGIDEFKLLHASTEEQIERVVLSALRDKTEILTDQYEKARHTYLAQHVKEFDTGAEITNFVLER